MGTTRGTVFVLLCLFLGYSCSGELPSRPTGRLVASDTSLRSAQSVELLKTLPFGAGMDFGAGLDELSGELLPSANCIEHDGIQPMTLYSEFTKAELVEDRDHFHDLVDVSAALGGTVGVVRFRLEGGFYKEVETKSKNVLLYLENNITTGAYKLKNPRMTLDGQADNVSGEVPNTRRNYFKSDYDSFRRKCGDRYLDTIVTGGRYVAVLEIIANSEHDKMKVWGELEGTYIPYMITIRAGLSILLENLDVDYDIKVHILSRGDNRVDNILAFSAADVTDEVDGDDEAWSVSDLVDDMERFHQEVLDRDATPSDYRKGAVSALFDSYEATAHQLTQGGNMQLQKSKIDGYKHAAGEHQKLEEKIRTIIAHPYKYQGVEERMGELTRQLNSLRVSRRRLEIEEEKCSVSNYKKCRTVEVISALDLGSITESLPSKKLEIPSNCEEIRDIYGNRTDGEYTVFLGGDSSQPFQLYCLKMRTPLPEAYLTLERTDPPTTTNPRDNFATKIGITNGYETPRLVTVFSKLKVFVNPDHLVVVPHQSEFLSTTTTGEGPDEWLDEKATIGEVPTCGVGRFWGGNINLAGTPFTLDPETEFHVYENQKTTIPESLTWMQAQHYAAEQNLTLARVFDEVDNQQMTAFLAQNEIEEAWLGLGNSREHTTIFDWVPQYSSLYRNWSNQALNYPVEPFALVCATLTEAGKWNKDSCRAKQRVILESSKVRGELKDFSQSTGYRQLNIYTEGFFGCATYGPKKHLILRYSSTAP